MENDDEKNEKDKDGEINRHDGEDKEDATGRPLPKGPEEKANSELLDPEARKDTHQDERDEPEPKDLHIGPDGGQQGGEGNTEDI
jgi:hypothetical protein